MAKVNFEKWDEDVLSFKSRRNAFLIIHGIGEQNPLETLDQFVRGMIKVLNRKFAKGGKTKYAVFHQQIDYQIQTREIWLENYITLDAGEGNPVFDIYEYYWAHHTSGKSSISDIINWLEDISTYAYRYYRKIADNGNNKKNSFKKRYKEEPTLKNLFDSDGYFHKNGYLRCLGIVTNIILKILKAIEISAFKNWPLVKMVFKFLWRKAEIVIVNYIGDIVIYTTMDRKSRHFEIRQKILRQARFELEGILRNKEYGAVFVAGHSLGSVIAYDLLNRLHKLPYPENEENIWKESFKKIKGLITFGSPLDKTAFWFRQQVAKDAQIHREMIENLHSFKKSKMIDPDLSDIEKIIIEDKTNHHLKDIKWLNFYDRNDPISGHLDLYDARNILLEMGEKYGIAHVKYWEYKEMYNQIFDSLGKEFI